MKNFGTTEILRKFRPNRGYFRSYGGMTAPERGYMRKILDIISSNERLSIRFEAGRKQMPCVAKAEEPRRVAVFGTWNPLPPNTEFCRKPYYI